MEEGEHAARGEAAAAGAGEAGHHGVEEDQQVVDEDVGHGAVVQKVVVDKLLDGFIALARGIHNNIMWCLKWELVIMIEPNDRKAQIVYL